MYVPAKLAFTRRLHHPRRMRVGRTTCPTLSIRSKANSVIAPNHSVSVSFLEKKENSVRILNYFAALSPKAASLQQNDLRSVIWVGMSSGWCRTLVQTPQAGCADVWDSLCPAHGERRVGAVAAARKSSHIPKEPCPGAGLHCPPSTKVCKAAISFTSPAEECHEEQCIAVHRLPEAALRKIPLQQQVRPKGKKISGFREILESHQKVWNALGKL